MKINISEDLLTFFYKNQQKVKKTRVKSMKIHITDDATLHFPEYM